MAKLDIEWLHVFVEVYKTQSVSRAAERLGMAQANASIALSKLRRHFGDRLFSRTSRGMEPTPYAQQIYPEVAAAVEGLAKLIGPRATFNPATAQRQFRICMTDISEIVVLPTLVNHLRRAGAGRADRDRADLDRQPARGSNPARSTWRSASCRSWKRASTSRRCSSRISSASRRGTTRACEAAAEQAGVSRRRTHRRDHAPAPATRSSTRSSRRRAIERRVVMKVPSFLAVARIVAQTELLVIVPRRLGEALAQQERVRLLDPPVKLPPFAVKQHWHERFHADAGNAWLRSTLAEVAGEVMSGLLAFVEPGHMIP